MKPTVKLIGSDGNVFALLGKCTKALKVNGEKEKASELTAKVMTCGSYDEALNLMGQYVEIE